MRSERDAVVALQQGDIDGLADLVRLHQLKALRTAFGILGDRSAAEDVVSDAFLKAYDRIRSFDADRPFEPWFYRLLVNLAIDHRRRARRAETIEQAPGTLNADAATARDEQLALAQHIQRLPRVERAVLLLHYYLDLDEAAIAGVLECPIGTVKSRLHRARERMRRSLTADPAEAWMPRSAQGV